MIFVDTSAWLAVADVRDGNYKAAIAYRDELLLGKAGRLVTSDYVLDETLTLLRKHIGIDSVRSFVHALGASRSVHQIWVTPEHYRAALALFLERPDRDWSFTDCTSFVIMRELSIRTAFTFDSDFRQAGFDKTPV